MIIYDETNDQKKKYCTQEAHTQDGGKKKKWYMAYYPPFLRAPRVYKRTGEDTARPAARPACLPAGRCGSKACVPQRR